MKQEDDLSILAVIQGKEMTVCKREVWICVSISAYKEDH